MTASIGWLHLSDLHQGLHPEDWLWPQAREGLWKDLERLHHVAGPFDLLLFTGDLTRSGAAGEFAALTRTLDRLDAELDRLGSRPWLLAVPGNHDLIRPPPRAPVVRALRQWREDSDLRDEFWSRPDCDYRRLVEESFAPFAAWWKARPLPAGGRLNHGLLPGDFAATFEKPGLRLGVVGLNSSFLQLTGDEFRGRLDLDVRQLHCACEGDAVDWLESHPAALLLTHHPPDWLNERARASYLAEIHPPDRFAAHLFGHLHEPASRAVAEAGALPRRWLQSASLLGLERLGNETNRIHGYHAGRLELSGTSGTLRTWPRILSRGDAGHLRLVPDSAFHLDETNAFAQSFTPRFAAGSPISPTVSSTRAVLQSLGEDGQVAGPPVIIAPGDEIVIGRGYGAAIRFEHHLVSKRHARVLLGSEGLIVEDLGSRNHVFVNGRQVERARIGAGDRVSLGQKGPRFEVAEAPPPVGTTISEE